MATDAQIRRARVAARKAINDGDDMIVEALQAAFPTASEFKAGIEGAAAALPAITGEFNPFLAPKAAGVDEISLEAQRETWREKARAAVGPWLRVAMRMEPPVEEAKND